MKRVLSERTGRFLKSSAGMLLLILLSSSGCGRGAAEKPGVETRRLSNGLRLTAVHMPGSTNLTIYSYLPMGLASDGLKQAQWSHLVEHLVVRSTTPSDSPQANAETLPDHLRLDFYGTTKDWREGLKHQLNWLRGVPFTQEKLTAEQPKVTAECDFTALNLATHKFAIAAWVQGYRHNQIHAAIKGDVERATLAEIQKYRDERLPVLSKAVVCVVSGLDPKKVFAEFSLPLGSLTGQPHTPAPLPLHPGNRDMTWDLDARHLVITWPVPGPFEKDHATLVVLGTWLNFQFSNDPELQKRVGMIVAGPHLATPEGSFFYVSASLRPDASLPQVRGRIGEHLAQVMSEKADLKDVAVIGQQLANSITTIVDPASLKDQLPPNVPLATVERNLGLQQGMHEFLFGEKKKDHVKELLAVNGTKLQEAVQIYLTIEKSSMITLRPVGTELAPAKKAQ